MRKTLLLFVMLTSITFGWSQTSAGNRGSSIGPSGGKCSNCLQPQDGSTVLGFTYQKDTCGLNYLTVSQKIGQRFSPAGPPQPCTVSVAGLPSCYYIEKAFLWCDASGMGTPITATITNPASVTQNYPMTLIGSDVDKCWGFLGTHSYRADVTSAISGNGNYVFSGFPVGPAGGNDDVDGFAMTIIYRDPAATWEGHITIWDGCVVMIGGNTTQTMTNLNVCANSTNQTAFMLIADLQGLGSTLAMNGSVPFTIAEDWWNYVDQPTAQFTPAQTTSTFDVASSGDCYNFMMMGVYYQTASCNVCTPQGSGTLTVTATGTDGCAPNAGTVTATASGGQGPYTYLWQPTGGTTQTLTNVPYQTYTVTVVDASGCLVGSDTVTISQLAPGPLTVTATGSGGCFANEGTVTATATGGQGPYTYLWQPTGGTTQTLTNVPYQTYTVSVVDATGCFTGTATVTVTQAAYPNAAFSLTGQYPGQLCMTDQTVGGAVWVWSMNNVPIDTTNDYCMALPDTGTYCVTLNVANAAGCPDTLTQCVTVLGEATISVPNVFTPNADGTNDVFEVTWTNLSALHCEIWDRWGVKIYEWDGLTGSWNGKTNNGKMATDGVYYWVVDATTTQGAQKSLHGFVHLISSK